MSEIEFPLDIAIVLAAALVGGMLAQALRLPVIAGYIAAGIAFGPETPGLDVDADQMQGIAELGVVLLMFALGIEFSFDEVSALGRRLPFLVLAQVALCVPLGLVLMPYFDLDVAEALFLGGIISISSTFVGLKILDDRGELNSSTGRVVVTFLIVQDLSVVALVNVLPELRGEAGATAVNLLLAALVAVSFLGIAFLVGRTLVPPVFERIALLRTRELFLLAVLSLGLGMALAAEEAGLSLAFGAFLAGLVVSESRYGLQALTQTLPLRDIFATVFFVAIGTLIDPATFVEEPLKIAALTLLIIGGKGALTLAACRLAGFGGESALKASFSLAQIGEFSFVLALVGVEEGLVSDELNNVVLAAVLLSILGSSLAAPRSAALAGIIRSAGLGDLVLGKEGAAVMPPIELTRHTVVCGYGRTGRELARVLQRREFKFLVIESDPAARRQAESDGVPFVYGDASSPVVLEKCNLETATLVAITFADQAGAELTLANARRLNPRIDVIVRGRGGEDHERLIDLGASEVVHPEVEGGLEFVRHALRRYGLPQQEIQAIVARRRRDFFRGQDPRE